MNWLPGEKRAHRLLDMLAAEGLASVDADGQVWRDQEWAAKCSRPAYSILDELLRSEDALGESMGLLFAARWAARYQSRELARVRAGIRSNTEGVLQDDPETGEPHLAMWEVGDLRDRLAELL